MTRVVLPAALAAGLFAATLQAQQTFRASTDVVRVFATVTDRDGRLATGLTQDQFEVRDDGRPQPITQFDNSPQPIRLIVLLDVSTSMEGNLPLLRGAADQLFGRLGADDLAKVGSFGHEVSIGGTFTRDLGTLRAAVPTTIAPDAPTPLWRAVDAGMEAFDAEDPNRRVILVLSDGKDSGPISFRHRPVSQAEAIERARRQDVMIYAVAMRSRLNRPMMPGIGPGGLQQMMLAELPDPGLARVAEESGGGYLEIRYGEDLAAAFAGVADELHSQYLLGFAPPKRDGKVHKLNVRVAGGGLKPRARKSYLAARE